jgi:hypothetical protein
MPEVQAAQLGNVVYKDSAVDPQGNPWCTPSVFIMEYDYGNSFFSFDFGMVHVINLNPYSNSNESSVQYSWLINDLRSVDRTITPWVIVMMHCPWYNSNTAHHNEYQTVLMKESMEAVFYKFKVNIAFTGHVHVTSIFHFLSITYIFTNVFHAVFLMNRPMSEVIRYIMTRSKMTERRTS